MKLNLPSASLDPGAAWEIVNQTNSSEHSDTPHHLRFTFGDNQSAQVGFFHGLESHELVQSYRDAIAKDFRLKLQ